MTATLAIDTGITTFDPTWDGSTTQDLGTIRSENYSVDNGTEVISQPGSGSDQAMSFSVLGQKLKITIQGTFYGTHDNILKFTNNMKILCNWEQSLANSTKITCMYKNTNSKFYSIHGGLDESGTGIKVMVMDFSSNDTDSTPPGIVNYTITLIHTRGL